jgi:hypothetical protein
MTAERAHVFATRWRLCDDMTAEIRIGDSGLSYWRYWILKAHGILSRGEESTAASHLFRTL